MANSRGYPRCATLLDNENTLFFYDNSYDKSNKVIENGRMVIVAKLVVPSAEEVDANAGH